MHQLLPAGGVKRLLIADGLLLLDTSSNRLFAFNGSAGLVWDLLQRGYSNNGIATDLAGRFGISDELAANDVRAIVDQWRLQGLIRTEHSTEPPPTPSEASATDWTRLPEPCWAVTLTCTIRDKVFTLAIEPPQFAQFPAIFFKQLETPSAPTDVRIEVRDAGGGDTALIVNGAERLRTSDGGQLIGGVNQTILEQIHPETQWLAIIHGAAVARNGSGLAFPAACGSGKTTLTAHLVASGYDYLADDHVALSAPDGWIVPWPLPMSIKEGSWDVLSSLYGDFSRFPQYLTKRGASRQLVPSNQVWKTEPAPLKAIVFPQYLRGATTGLTKLSTFEALVRLLGDQIWLGYPVREDRVSNFIEWLDTRPAYALVHSSAADAARCIEGIK